METNQKLENVKEVYEKPQIEVIEMEMESSILADSAKNFGNGGGSSWS